MKPEVNFVRRSDAILPSRPEWLEGWPNCLPNDGLMDGSKTSEGTGAGGWSIHSGTKGGIVVLNQMGLMNQITLAWVPGHSGLEGNEVANKLAILGSAS